MSSAFGPSSAGLKFRRIFDRRRPDRLALPACEHCGSADTAIATRTENVIYIRCVTCLQVWSVPKPGREPMGT